MLLQNQRRPHTGGRDWRCVWAATVGVSVGLLPWVVSSGLGWRRSVRLGRVEPPYSHLGPAKQSVAGVEKSLGAELDQAVARYRQHRDAAVEQYRSEWKTARRAGCSPRELRADGYRRPRPRGPARLWHDLAERYQQFVARGGRR